VKEMAEETENIAEPKGRGTQPFILGGILVLIIGLAGGIFAADLVNTEDEAASNDASATAGVGGGSAPAVVADTITHDLGEFSINLKDPSTMRILQMRIVLECESAMKPKIEAKTPQLRDSVLMFASEYTVTSLAGMEGKMNLRDEILMRINSILKPERVERVYFTKFIIGK
jgi:flagellar protein FliL